LAGLIRRPASDPPRRFFRRDECVPALARVCVAAALACLTARAARARAPDAPSQLSPAAEVMASAMPPRLSAWVKDRDGDSLTVTFYGRAVTSAGPDFTLIEIPDTQYYSASMYGATPATFRSQTQWIADNRVTRNVAYVAHVGDIVQHCDSIPAEWASADGCMKLLEDPAKTMLPAGIPFGVAPGSHDIGGTGAVVCYNQYFGVARFQGRAYYGGHFGADNANWFGLWSASGLDFIVIGLKLMWNQDPAPLHWADSLLTAYPKRRAILVSHYLLDPGPPATFSPQGQAIYGALKGHANLMLMICGHYVNDARRSDTWNGHTVHTVMSNYQNIGRGGDGWLRIMEFSPVHNQIRMRTYSPWLGQSWVTPDSSKQFTLSCDLSGGDGGFHPIGSLRKVASGSTASIQWTGLQSGKKYEWYATASDGSNTTTGAAASFTLGDDLPPATRVAAPNGGEVLLAGQWADLEWSAVDDGSGTMNVDVLLSRDGSGGPWEALASAFPNSGDYRWRVTGPATAQAYFAVVARDSFNNFTVDRSDGAFRISAATGVGDGPESLSLEPVAPNPTRGQGHFTAFLPQAGPIRLAVLDVAGREVAVLADGPAAAGRNEFVWDGRSGSARAPAGIYVLRLEAGSAVLTRKFAIAR
jgi:hypothetical protein